MPTLSDTLPDIVNLDAFFSQYPNRFGIWVYDKKPLTGRPTPSNLKPTQCFTHIRKNEKATHFFKAPNTIAEVFCLCNKYHTQFISANNTTYNLNDKNLTEVNSNNGCKNMSKKLQQTTEFVPPSPSKQVTLTPCSHSCIKCQLPTNCNFDPQENRHYLHDNAIYFMDNIYHKLCLPSNDTLQPLTPTSHQTTSNTTLQPKQKLVSSSFNQAD